MATFTTVEFASTDVRASASFMAEAFGFTSTFYGPAYADIHPGAGVTVAFQGDPAEMPSSPLAIFEVPDLDEAEARVVAAGAWSPSSRSPSRAAAASSSASRAATNWPPG